MNESETQEQAVEPISAEEADALLEAAIRERLGPDWDDEQDGWVVVARHNYMARLARSGRIVDVYVDLLGQVTVEEKQAEENTGRLLAWMLLGGSLLVAMLIARLAGYL